MERAPPPETTSKIKGREGARKRSISKLDRAGSAPRNPTPPDAQLPRPNRSTIRLTRLVLSVSCSTKSVPDRGRSRPTCRNAMTTARRSRSFRSTAGRRCEAALASKVGHFRRWPESQRYRRRQPFDSTIYVATILPNRISLVGLSYFCVSSCLTSTARCGGMGGERAS
jgi:hypothetical protein